jgi:hypothetical protein
MQSHQQVMHILGQCHATFVTELVPFSLREVTARTEHEADRVTTHADLGRCPHVCGRLRLVADVAQWCGGRSVTLGRIPNPALSPNAGPTSSRRWQPQPDLNSGQTS